MFNSLVVVSVATFTQGALDKNNLMPVILRPIAGKMPNKAMVISGSIAESEGFEVGKSYLAQIRETDADPQYGRQFRHTKLNEISAMEVIDSQIKLGEAEVFDVTGTASDDESKKEAAKSSSRSTKTEAAKAEDEIK